MARITGTVKWFNNSKGFGFLGQGDGPDVFCHYSGIEADGYKFSRKATKWSSISSRARRGRKRTRSYECKRQHDARGIYV